MKASNVLAFLGGAAAGALIALLTTPKTGAENRQALIEKLKSGAELTKQELQDLTAWLKDKVQESEVAAEIEDITEEIEENC
ncbi:YtxH domain-containing protein [Bacteroidales bacterium OttesenSCG-928-B11]|nr:YtxH domain-containing protein [Bacteroidales bacterium OttesenSCG-928-B11]MDL2326247.1 YtxH domain-containing protein [Bacteroidales bacterium OttesenSCG-928-A14]